MNIQKYKILLRAVDTGSFTKAAAELNYTPSGVTHMMNSIEEELGFPLLKRSPRGVCPTKEGEKILPIIREIVKWEENLVQTTAEIRGAHYGTLVLASYSSIASRWLPGIIRDFKKDYPNIRIKIMEGVWQEVAENLDRNMADLGFMSYQENTKYEWILLQEDPMLAILPLTHKRAKDASYPLSACLEEEIIMPASGHDFDVEQLFKKEHLKPEMSYETIENYSALSMIEKGIGMSIMNELITLGRTADVVKIPLDPPCSIHMGVACTDFTKLSPAARIFLEYVLKAFPDWHKKS